MYSRILNSMDFLATSPGPVVYLIFHTLPLTQVLTYLCMSFSHFSMYVCMYVREVDQNPVPEPRPTMIYCASPLVNPLLILYSE
jgi:hypothetical protein